ncbi:unnamed protein product, partial [Discosporangium mesarthrocarpum]
MTTKKKRTLSDRLADLTSAAPSTSFNPDAPEYNDGTNAGLVSYDDDDGGIVGGDPSLRPSSSLRVAADMEDIGREYRGKRVSRASLATSMGGKEDGEPGTLGIGDGSGDSMEEHDESEPSGQDKLTLDGVSSSEEEEEDGGSGGEGDEDRERKGPGVRGQQDSVFAGMGGGIDDLLNDQIAQLDRQDERAHKGRMRAGEGELSRAREVLRQQQWWESTLEIRILLQRLLNSVNRLPGKDMLPLYLEGNPELGVLAEKAHQAAEGLTNDLSTARRVHMSCWGITPCQKKERGGENREAQKGGREEEEEGEEGGEDDDASLKDYRGCMAWWEGVVNRWHQRTQSVDTSLQRKFKVVNQGVWVQVQASLADRGRVSRKAFMTKAETEDFLGRKLAKRLKVGVEEGTADAAKGGDVGEAGHPGDGSVLGRERRSTGGGPLDKEVVDDREFYQHLLKEFVDSSGGDGAGYERAAGAPVRHRSRKKVVDQRASKGRKLKYVTHPKMQNFMYSQ